LKKKRKKELERNFRKLLFVVVEVVVEVVHCTFAHISTPALLTH
jgi:hypothetical protein